MESKLIYHHKALIQNKFLLELKLRIFESPPERFPDSIKYNLLFLEIKTGKRIIFDNHLPKGDHYHINDKEFPYNFINEDILINDFKNLVKDIFGVIL